MRTMARKRSNSDKPKQPRPNRSGLPLHVYLDVELRRTIDQLVLQTRRSLTTEVTIALEEHLKRAGLWPPPPPPVAPPSQG